MSSPHLLTLTPPNKHHIAMFYQHLYINKEHINQPKIANNHAHESLNNIIHDFAEMSSSQFPTHQFDHLSLSRQPSPQFLNLTPTPFHILIPPQSFAISASSTHPPSQPSPLYLTSSFIATEPVPSSFDDENISTTPTSSPAPTISTPSLLRALIIDPISAWIVKHNTYAMPEGYELASPQSCRICDSLSSYLPQLSAISHSDLTPQTPIAAQTSSDQKLPSTSIILEKQHSRVDSS